MVAVGPIATWMKCLAILQTYIKQLGSCGRHPFLCTWSCQDILSTLHPVPLPQVMGLGTDYTQNTYKASIAVSVRLWCRYMHIVHAGESSKSKLLGSLQGFWPLGSVNLPYFICSHVYVGIVSKVCLLYTANFEWSSLRVEPLVHVRDYSWPLLVS